MFVFNVCTFFSFYKQLHFRPLEAQIFENRGNLVATFDAQIGNSLATFEPEIGRFCQILLIFLIFVPKIRSGLYRQKIQDSADNFLNGAP